MKTDRYGRTDWDHIKKNTLMIVGYLVLIYLVMWLFEQRTHGQEITTSPIYSVRQGELLVLELSEDTCFHGLQPLNNR